MSTPLHELLDDLEKKANAATKGEWLLSDSGECISSTEQSEDEWPICVDENASLSNLKFIVAANPEQVKKLLEALRVADAALNVRGDSLACSCCGSDDSVEEHLSKARGEIHKILGVKE